MRATSSAWPTTPTASRATRRSSAWPRLGIVFDEEQLSEDFDTIGGLIAHEMGHVPKRGEHHAIGGFDFVVLHTKGGAVRWFKVSPARGGDAAD